MSPEAVVADLTRDRLLEIYHYLQLTRQFEDVLAHLYRQDKILGGLYRSLGQEAGAVGTAYALRRRADGTGDVVSPAIRDLGALFVMGARPVDVMRQYMARADGPTGGRETNVHFSDYERGFVGLISHLGVMVEVMAGVALAFKLRDQERVGLVYIGDGGASTGGFHEGVSVAAAQGLPLVVVVESNGYAYSTPTAMQTAVGSFVEKAEGYGMRGASCDGNDVLAVYETTRGLVEQARAGNGPGLLELVTYRRKGHAEHDSQSYCPPGEIEEWEAKDPLDRYRTRLLDEGWAVEPELAGVEEGVRREIESVRESAEASAMPAGPEVLEAVTSEGAAAAPWTRLPQPDPHEA